MTGLYYEESEVGEPIEYERRRTISESDNQRFCGTMMNQQPLHLDAASASKAGFGERLVNGLYTMSLPVGTTVPGTTNGAIVAHLSYDDVEHPEPMFHGDIIQVQSTITEKREISDGERGIVTMHVEVFKVDGPDAPLVCEFDRTVLSLRGDHAVS
jgi:acyl dehydratase